MPSKPELLPRISRLIRGRRQIFLVVERAQQTKVHTYITKAYVVPFSGRPVSLSEQCHSLGQSASSYYMEYSGAQRLSASCRVALFTSTLSQPRIVFEEKLCA